MTPKSNFDALTCALDGTQMIEASAGTGKTWNICGIYLRFLLERRLQVQQILVVTFTNAATAELRERIRSRIVEMRDYLASKHPVSFDPFISKLGEALLKDDRHDRTEMLNLLELNLQTFDEASIFTIHGFCQRALADSAFAAGQAFSLELTPDDSEILMEAVHDFWRRYIASENIDDRLATYLLKRKDSPEKYATLLKRKLAKPLADTLWPDGMEATTFDGTELAMFYQTAKHCWRENRDQIIDLLVNATNVLNQRSYSEKQIRNAATGFDVIFDADDPFYSDTEAGQPILFRSSHLSGKTKKGKTSPEHPFFDLAERLLDAREQAEKSLEPARLQLIRRLLEEASKDIQQRKRERRMISFDDMLHNVHAALTNGENPYLAESLRTRFPAALVDEFQDTDPLQFAVFRKIYGASENPLFFVGDPKQAIYRFRNADLHTYLTAKQHASAIHSIADNQRSSKPLINALNQLFGSNPQCFMLDGLAYQPTGMGAKPRKPFSDTSRPTGDLQLWMLPNEAEGHITLQQARQHAQEATAAEIARLLNAAKAGQITIEGKPLRAGDIAVLVRTHRQGSNIRRALARLNVGSVELSQESVFNSPEAEEVERVFAAIWMPARLPLLRAALATELLGCDAAMLATLSTDESQLMQRIQDFADYRALWLQRGIGFVYRHILSKEGISKRMLRRTDGERRMTNLLHLGELLHQAADSHPTPDSLLRWLQSQRREARTDEAAQLRLESDQNLVQILTIHKSKGLEFPVVFCPHLWESPAKSGGSLEGSEYHNEQGQTVIDFRPEPGDIKHIKQNIRQENDAESMRLIYVALTRAVYRCYLITGCYLSRKSSNQSRTSLLNWLAAGNGLTPEQWIDSKRNQKTTADIENAWAALASSSDGSISLSPLSKVTGEPLASDLPSPETLVCQPVPTCIPAGWRITSYSGLSRGATHDNAASDHDLALEEAPGHSDAAPAMADDDILHFPKGANAGDCIHKVFELCDFADPASWEAAIEQALSVHPQASDDAQSTTRLKARLQHMLQNVLDRQLNDRIFLSSIKQKQRLTELGFHLPLGKMNAGRLNRLLRELGYSVPSLVFNDLQGYLKGFIDLIFEYEGRFYILDWKSNHLGFEKNSYRKESIAEAMDASGYHLQYLLYAVALNRYLKRRMRGYRYDVHFGGVLYLFVRGVRPEWVNADGSPSGIYFHRPDEQALLQLDALFAPESPKAA